MQQHNNNNCIMLLSPAGQIQYACKNTLQRFQQTAEQLCTQDLNQLKHPDMPAGPLKDLQEVVGQGRPWMGVVQLQDASGEFWANAYVVPVTENSQVLELHCILSPANAAITERAREVYRLRKAGKMPRRLRYPPPSLAHRSSLLALAAFMPLIVFTAICMPSVSLLAVIAICCILLYVLQQGLFGPFKRLVQTTRTIVQHPIKQLIYTDTSDDVGQLQLTLDMQQEQMRALLQRIRNTSDHIRQRSGQSMQGMQRICSDVAQQQDILRQLSQTAGEMSQSASATDQQVQHNLNQSKEATLQVGVGQQTLQQSIRCIHQLAGSINESMQHFVQLQQKSEQINDIMTVIQTVAEQTNLLALNAAIEAARAGEMGRGFAVVADEVRNLAAQTQRSAQDIHTMIKELQQATQAISQCLASEQELSANSVEQIGQAEQAFEQILAFIHQLHDNMTILEGFSRQQDAISAQVTGRVGSLQALTEQANQDAEESLKYNRGMATMSERQSLMLAGLAQA